MKVALCCIGKCENRYIKEYVSYYKSLNFDKIFLFDNNLEDGEHFEDVIGEYINSGFVEITDYRGKINCQNEAYNECHKLHGKDYDWIAYFDCDEFLTFRGKIDVHDFLSKKEFEGFNKIYLNWLCFSDNGLNGDENIGYSVLGRFPSPVMPIDFKRSDNLPENFHIKSIVRGNVDVNFINPHSPYNVTPACNDKGVVCNPVSNYAPFNYEVAFLRHYVTKTATEYREKIMDRWYPDYHPDIEHLKPVLLERFFKSNLYTDKKAKILGVPLASPDLDIFICSHKDFDTFPNNPVYKIIHGTEKINVPLEQITETETELSKYQFSLAEGSRIYWIYKNYDVKKYIGISHYRKYFNFYDNIPNIDKLFEDCDIYTIGMDCGDSLKNQYYIHHNKNDFDLMVSLVKNKLPEESQKIDEIINERILFNCNMFIMKREDFYKYCDFIYSILKEFINIRGFKDDNDIKKYVLEHKDEYIKNHESFPEESSPEYQSRILGYLMERISTIYISLMFKKIKLGKILITKNKF